MLVVKFHINVATPIYYDFQITKILIKLYE